MVYIVQDPPTLNSLNLFDPIQGLYNFEDKIIDYCKDPARSKTFKNAALIASIVNFAFSILITAGLVTAGFLIGGVPGAVLAAFPALAYLHASKRIIDELQDSPT